MYSNLPAFLNSPDCVVVAACDADAWRLEQGLNAVQKHYGKAGCKGYRDFRELLARPDIDAVMISTPDHWHVPIAIAAVNTGKDVALEKPITRYINEGRILADLVAKHKCVFRVDSEFRSLAHFHRAVELVRNGRIGKLHTIHTGSPKEEFANGVEMFYQMGTPHVRFEGEKGWIQVTYPGQLEASDPALLRKKISPDEIHFPLRTEKEDFIDAIKTRGRTLEDAEVGHLTTSLCHLALISIKLGGVKLRWDPDREVFLDNEAANKLINRPPLRPPWKLE